VLYADEGSTEDLLAAARSLQQLAINQAAAALPRVRGYLDEEHPTPFAPRLHIIARHRPVPHQRDCRALLSSQLPSTVLTPPPSDVSGVPLVAG
jgi:hypothetical protein